MNYLAHLSKTTDLRTSERWTLAVVKQRMHRGRGVTKQNIPGQNIPGQKYTEQYIPDKIYQTKGTWTKHTNMYRTKFTGQNIPDKIYRKIHIISCRPIRRSTLVLGLGLGLGARAEWATEESLKHPMAVYVRIYFKLKYTLYIFDGIFCSIYFVWYILTGLFCPVYIVW